MREVLLVLSFLSLASGQQLNFDFRAQRFQPPHENLLKFYCENINGPASNPMFFRNGYPVSVEPTPDDTFLYRIDRELEGDFSCGVQTQFGMTESTSKKLVAYPDNMVRPINKGPFHGEAGFTVRLDCSITPGVVVEQYYVTWKSVSNQSKVFYESFPPSLNWNPVNADPKRYSVHPNNFSLFIRDVTPADGTYDYACVLGVEDPQLTGRNLLFTSTESTNLTLSIFSPPKFLVKPDLRVAVRGSSVNFTCSTLSSPRPTNIRWLLEGETVEPSNRFTIVSDSSAFQEGSNVTLSRLTISDVSGFDSGSVECEATYSSADFSEVNTISSATQLAVLDEVGSFHPSPLASGGFLYEIGLKAPLTIPVRLLLVYSDLSSDRSMSFMSSVAYSNSKKISHVASRDRVPFDVFQVRIALVHEDLTGPFFHHDNHYRRAGLSDTDISLRFLTFFFGISLFFTIIIVVLICMDKKTRDSSNMFINAKWNKLLCCKKDEGSEGSGNEEGHGNNCRQGTDIFDGEKDIPDGETGSLGETNWKKGKRKILLPRCSKNGYTTSMARRYVEMLKETIEFAKKDCMIRDVLKDSPLQPLLNLATRPLLTNGVHKPLGQQETKQSGHVSLQLPDQPMEESYDQPVEVHGQSVVDAGFVKSEAKADFGIPEQSVDEVDFGRPEQSDEADIGRPEQSVDEADIGRPEQADIGMPEQSVDEADIGRPEQSMQPPESSCVFTYEVNEI